MLTTVLRHAIEDPSEYGLSFILGEISTDSMGFLVISIRGSNLRSLQNRLEDGCKSLNTAHSIEHLGNIMLFTPKKGDNLHYHQLEQELHWDKTPDVFLINEVNAFSSYSSRPGCTTINLLSPKDAKYQAKAKQTDALMHPWKEDTAQMYSCTISLELPDSCKNIIMEGVTKYYVDQPRMIQEVIPWESMRNISPFY